MSQMKTKNCCYSSKNRNRHKTHGLVLEHIANIHHPPPIWAFSLPFSVRRITLIKVTPRHVNMASCGWALRMNCVGDRWAKKRFIPPPFPLYCIFSHQLTFYISPDSDFTSHVAVEAPSFPFRSPGRRGSLPFNQSLLRLPGGLEPRWGLHIADCPMIFSWVMISEPDLWSSHSDCEILSQWRDNGFSWTSGFRWKPAVGRGCIKLRQWRCIQHFKIKCDSYLDPFSSAYVDFTPPHQSFCINVVCNWTSWHSLISSP